MNSQCPYTGRCGACQYTGLPYERQLQKKQETMERLLGKFTPVEPIIGMESPEHYRCKVHHVFGTDKGRHIISGCYEERTHRLVDIAECLIEDELSQQVINEIKKLAHSFKLSIYNEDTGRGLLRHVLVRRGRFTGELMVVLVMSSPVFPGKNNFIKALREKFPEITTIVLNVNDSDTSMVLGNAEKILYGPGYIRDRICGCTFRISASSFYQVNPVQAEVLYRRAIELAGLTGKETVVDAYCGTGTIGIAAACGLQTAGTPANGNNAAKAGGAAGRAARVIGIELNPAAVRDARLNARENNAADASFIVGDAGEVLESLASGEPWNHAGKQRHYAGNRERNGINSISGSRDINGKSGAGIIGGEKPDVIIMDPPRTGSTEKFMRAAAMARPSRIVYVSCSPVTLARDLKYFKTLGYRTVRICPVDMFPYTDNIEAAALLTI